MLWLLKRLKAPKIVKIGYVLEQILVHIEEELAERWPLDEMIDCGPGERQLGDVWSWRKISSLLR